MAVGGDSFGRFLAQQLESSAADMVYASLARDHAAH
jgi:hypothetical protein